MSSPPPLRRRLLSTYREQPSFDGEKSESALEIIRLLTEYISDNRLVSIRQKRLADTLLSLIRDRLAERFTVTQAAAETGRSVSTVNQTLKAFTGKSFKQNQLSIRMDAAARLLLEEPESSVGETAARLGVDDPFYFSRIFKKYNGLSPREYRIRRLKKQDGD
jgi:AraC-like DNA-binding protein